jgi:hypothetical protein
VQPGPGHAPPGFVAPGGPGAMAPSTRNGIDVQVSYAGRAGCASAIGGTVLLLFAITMVMALINGDEIKVDPPIFLVFPIFGLVWFIIPLILRGEKMGHARRIDANGVTTYGGRQLAWPLFRGIREKRQVARSGGSFVLGYELSFQSGSATLLARPTKNWGELAPLIAALQNGDVAWVVRSFGGGA